jgi:hypothetical protein
MIARNGTLIIMIDLEGRRADVHPDMVDAYRAGGYVIDEDDADVS